MLKKTFDLEDESDISLSNKYFDIILIQKKAASLITDVFTIGLQLVIGLSLISFYHPFFLVFSLFIILLGVLPLFYYRKKAQKSAVEESTKKYNTADWIQNYSMKAKGCELKEDIKKADSKIQAYLEMRADHFRTLFKIHVFYISSFALLNSLLLLIGGSLVINEQLSVGQLIAAEMVINGILYHFLYAQKYVENFFDLYAACVKLLTFYIIDDQIKEKETSDHPFLTSKKFKNKFYNQFKAVRSIRNPTRPIKRLKTFAVSSVVFLLFLLLTPWWQTSLGEGQLTAFDPNDRAQFITATVSGRVDEWLVIDGQQVEKGDPIVNILDNDPNFMARLENQRDAAVRKFEAAKQARETAKLNYNRQRKLAEEGLAARKDLEKARITYNKLQSDEASAADSLAKAEIALSRQALQTITAPRSGRILRILLGSGTVNVKTGDKLVHFVPEIETAAVELYLNSNDLPLVEKGRKVRLQFEGWPAIQFGGWPSVAIGSFGGVVQTVDPMVTQKGLFRVIVSPDPNDKHDWPSQEFLQQGTRVVGLVILERVSIGYELWRKINGFPKSFRNNAYKEIKLGK
jgi:RND family efflux transporter MFP subunit